MKISFTSWTNKPDEFIGLEPPFKRLMRENINQYILSNPFFDQVKAQHLEILICTYNGFFEVKKISKTDKNKYFTFQFWLPYPKIMETENYLLTFVDYVFEGLIQVFEPYKVPEKLIRQVQTNIKNEVLQNPKLYEYVEPEYEKHIRAALEKWNKNQAEKQNLANER